MSIAPSSLAEFEGPAPITRKFLERLPEDKLTWKPHNKSMSAGQFAYRPASVPGGVRHVQNNPAPAPEFVSFPQPASRQNILKTFEENIAAVRSLLPKYDDKLMKETRRMVADGREVLAQPPAAFSARREAEPLAPTPRPIQCIPANARRGRASKLGTERGRTSSFRAKGSNGLVAL